MEKNKAFTLIELLVVIAIIGILSGLVVVSMNGAINSAKDTKRKTDVDSMKKALLFYKTFNNTYPVATCSVSSSCTALNNALVPTYLQSLPSDPNSDLSYSYTSTNGSDFTVGSTLSSSTGYSYTASTGYGTVGGISNSYASTCAAATGNGLTCTETSLGGDVVNTFTSTTSGSNNWTVPAGVTQVRYLIIGGGGGAGGWSGANANCYWNAGGGAGGFVTGTMSVTPQANLNISVGDGGIGGIANISGNSGNNSNLGTLIALGGGGGGAPRKASLNGGSGGGGGGSDSGPNLTGGLATQPGSSTGGSGNAGGLGYTAAGGGQIAAGGGGGAGAVGGAAASQSGGAGGVGLQSDISGANIYYAGGGGGCAAMTFGPCGAGGNGGGGAGIYGVGTPGTNGLGGGGGAGNPAAKGGAGIVVIRYTHP